MAKKKKEARMTKAQREADTTKLFFYIYPNLLQVPEKHRMTKKEKEARMGHDQREA